MSVHQRLSAQSMTRGAEMTAQPAAVGARLRVQPAAQGGPGPVLVAVLARAAVRLREGREGHARLGPGVWSHRRLRKRGADHLSGPGVE